LFNIQEAHDLLGMLAIQRGKVDYQWPFACPNVVQQLPDYKYEVRN
jgi:hypothetical protein